MNTTLNSEIFEKILDERARQDRKWGEQNWPLCVASKGVKRLREDISKRRCDEAAAETALDWDTILEEEIAEAMGAETVDDAIHELIQAAAVIFATIECLERNRE